MSARGTRRVACALLLAAGLGGCAAGEWLAGAPPRGQRAGAVGLLARRCATCHAAPDPRSMSGEAWLGALERMRTKVRLDAAQWDSLAAMARP